MAPEVVNGSICAKSDVWALSMTVIQLLLGKAPFEVSVNG